MSADCRLTVSVRPAADEREVEAALRLRVEVFCGEQGVNEAEELDDLDAQSLQIVATDEARVLATCRLRDLDRDTAAPDAKPRSRGDSWKLERMVVAKPVRGLGVGQRLLAGAEREARDRGAREIVLHAQRRAEDFYAAGGYAPEGETFTEAGIEHVRMRKALGDG